MHFQRRRAAFPRSPVQPFKRAQRDLHRWSLAPGVGVAIELALVFMTAGRIASLIAALPPASAIALLICLERSCNFMTSSKSAMVSCPNDCPVANS